MNKEIWIIDREEIDNMWFDEPKQVAFIEEVESDIVTENVVIGGIAYEDFIICGECGGRVDLSDVEAIYIFNDWISINEEILGETDMEVAE